MRANTGSATGCRLRGGARSLRAAAGRVAYGCRRSQGHGRALGRLETLRRKRDIDELFRRGRRVRGEYLTLVNVRTTLARQRVLLVTSRKTGNAVRRNKLRRWLREAWRALSPSIPQGVDCALIVAPRTSAMTYWELFEELSGLLRRAKLLPTAPI